MGTLRENFEKIETQIQAISTDLDVAENGGIAGGTRVRNNLSDIAKLAKEMRAQVIAIRNEAKANKA